MRASRRTVVVVWMPPKPVHHAVFIVVLMVMRMSVFVGTGSGGKHQ